MTIYLSRGKNDPEISVPFPTTPDAVWCAITELDEHCSSSEPVKIVGAFSPVEGLSGHISCADMEEETDILALNMLTGLIDSMTAKEKGDLSAALDTENPGSLDSILQIAGRIAPYEIVDGVKSDKELGGWLVKHGLADTDFPDAVRPYLDYSEIGAEYRIRHGGIFTLQGYLKRRAANPEQTTERKTGLTLILSSGHHTHQLDFPASESELEAAKQVLGVEELTDDMIDSILNGCLCCDHLPLEDVTINGLNTLARYVQQMSDNEQKVFSAALEAEEPSSFADAVCIAEDLEDYELVDVTEYTYGREALRKAGANDEVFELLDGFIDYERLGQAMMESDGVRATSYGMIRCPDNGHIRQEPGGMRLETQSPGLTIGGMS